MKSRSAAERQDPAPRRPGRHVVVAGDVTIDWNLARSGEPSTYAFWSSGRQTKASPQAGGAALLGVAVERMVKDCFPPGTTVWYPQVDPKAPAAHSGIYCSSFSVWTPFPKVCPPGKPNEIWRVQEYLGADPAAAAAPGASVPGAPASCDLVILDDAGLGFREQRGAWPAAIGAGRKPTILLKMSVWQDDQGDFQRLASGSLFDHLHQHHADRLTVLINASDLRLRDASVSHDISWEQTAQDMAHEFLYNPSLARLAGCAHVVVRLGASGAFLYSRNAGRPICLLFYDPAELSDSWERARPGGSIGYTVCMAAALARQLLEQPQRPNWKVAVQLGIGAQRELHVKGYQCPAGSPPGVLEFPRDAVAAELRHPVPANDDDPWPGTELAEAHVPPPPPGQGLSAGDWTILGARYPFPLGLAESVVLQGHQSALRSHKNSKILSVPLAQFGAMKTVDRQEIENLRAIGRLVGEYSKQHSGQPLSFAVFGPPGCGKSFAIEQLASSIIPGKTTKLTFNLSQFASPAELAEAFHQVRDAALRGEMPLVFWDEFDSTLGARKLGWLKYFLAPMQDGCFQAGPLTHPVGRAIFAFAGSVCSTMAEFEAYSTGKDFKDAKGRDFISRLKGFVNILGPNCQAKGGDPHYILRRALILRDTLQRERPRLFGAKGALRIDAGVLRALLFIGEYRHGVRSLSSVIAMSALEGKLKFERSCLPPAAQLDLHVDAREFLAITNGVQFADLDAAAIERMAQIAHGEFYRFLTAKGYTRKTHSACIKDFYKLPPDEQNQNREFVRQIPDRLIQAGYTVGILPAGARPTAMPRSSLESLAEMEHERWMLRKLADGWSYAATTNKPVRLHECLLPWRAMSEAEMRLRYGAWANAMGRTALPEKEKEKDRVLVRAIPRMLTPENMRLVRIPD